MAEITVAIASIGRASLARTLRSLAALSQAPGTVISVVVADDSPDGAALRLIEGLSLEDLPVRCLKVASGNISVARNALIDAASGDWIAWVDDDEWVEPDWLVRLLDCAHEYKADVVVGPVLPEYPGDAPEWVVRAKPHYNEWGHRGKRLSTGRGGNTLVRTGLFRELGLRFDPALGVTGGEDTALFAAAAAKGAVIVATDDAIAYEPVPPERLAPSYILRRAVRSGQSYGHARLGERSWPGWRVVFGFAVLVKCVAAAVFALALRPFDRARSFRMRQKLALNLGKLRAVFGLPLAQLYKQAA